MSAHKSPSRGIAANPFKDERVEERTADGRHRIRRQEASKWARDERQPAGKDDILLSSGRVQPEFRPPGAHQPAASIVLYGNADIPQKNDRRPLVRAYPSKHLTNAGLPAPRPTTVPITCPLPARGSPILKTVFRRIRRSDSWHGQGRPRIRLGRSRRSERRRHRRRPATTRATEPLDQQGSSPTSSTNRRNRPRTRSFVFELE